MKPSKKLQRLLESRKKATADMRAISATAEADNGRNLNKEEETRFEALEAEHRALSTEIEREERLCQAEDTEERAGEEYADDPAYGAGGERRSDDEEREEEERSERGAVQRGQGSGAGNGKSKWESFGQFLTAVAAAENHRADPRLIKVRSISGMNESTPAEGGFLVEKEQIGGLMQRTWEISSLYNRCKKITIGAGKNGLTMLRLKDNSRATGSRFGGIRCYWLGEGQDKIKSRPEMDVLEMKLKKLAALCYVTDELLEDATGLESLLDTLFPQEMAFTIDDAILYGTGVGMPLGIVNSGAVVTVAKESGQSADTIKLENILKMVAAFWETPGSNPVWFINRNIIPQLSTLTLATGTSSGVAVWMPPTGLAGNRFGTLLGYPVVPIEQAASLGDLGDIWLNDMSQYLVAEKGGIKRDVSIHVRFVQDETCFRFVKRIDGQPIPTAAVTPYKGASGEKLGSFVTLEAR